MATISKIGVVVRLVSRKVVVAPRESVLGVRMALWVILVSILARVTSLPRAQQIAAFRFRSGSVSVRTPPAQLARTIDGLLRLDFLVFRPSCWKRALVLHRFLILNGIESRINFGIQRNAGGAVRGHAWLEQHGQPFLEHDLRHYVVTFSLPQNPQDARPAAEIPELSS